MKTVLRRHCNLAVNAAAVAIMMLGLWAGNGLLTAIGVFAASGGLTNWLAVYMLFERVPFLYGSGVIPAKFTTFRAALGTLVVEQFLQPSQLQALADTMESKAREKLAEQLPVLLERIDVDAIYQKLVAAIMQSSFGSMLGMIGGEKALQPIENKAKEKLREALADASVQVQHALDDVTFINIDQAHDALIAMIQTRLDDLTPAMVKQLAEDLMRSHLHWLVIWGAVAGGILGGVFEMSKRLMQHYGLIL